MAGYIIYSLDWTKFNQFVHEPMDAQLLAFANYVSDELDEYDAEFADGDPVHDWPSEPDKLKEILRPRIALPDWYSDLSDVGKTVFEQSLTGFSQDEETMLGFDVEDDGVYWPVIEIAQKHHGIKPDHFTELELSQFGHRPYRYHPKIGSRLPDPFTGWSPTHSMQMPEEVQRLQDQLKAAEDTIRKSRNDEAQQDYEVLMAAVANVVDAKRVLYIQVDT